MVPSHLLGELIDNVLYVQPRPRPKHAVIIGEIIAALSDPYQKNRGGPGGWWILPEPGIELPGAPEIVPDVAGWRRERLPVLPDGPLTLAPDWACEVLSPSNRRDDLRIKRPFYARVGVSYLWYVDQEARVLTVSSLQRGQWLEIGTYADKEKFRADPFGELEMNLADWWAGDEA